MQPTGNSRHRRRGAAVVELAVCLPALFVFILGSIEACNSIFLKQTLTEAAYEGALLGSRPGVAETEIVQHVEGVLAARKVTNASVTVGGSGQGYDTLLSGKAFSVQVQANAGSNIPGPKLFATFAMIEASVTGHKQ